MIAISRSQDYELIRKVFNTPERGFDPPRGESYIYAIVWVDGIASGCFWLIPASGRSVHVHIHFHRSIWGQTREVVRLGLEWGWANTEFLKVIAVISEHRKLAIRLVEDAGYTRFAIDRASATQDGKLCDQIMLEYFRPEAR